MDALFAVEKDRLVSTHRGVYLQLQQAEIEADGLWTHLKGFDFVTLFREEQAGKVRHYIYYTYAEKGKKVSRVDFEKAHKQHWHIELFHRPIKQLCNAEHFLLPRSCAVKTHIFSLYWALLALEEKLVNKIIDNWYQFREKIQQQFIKANLT